MDLNEYQDTLSPDGTRLATTSDNVVRICDISPNLLEASRYHAARRYGVERIPVPMGRAWQQRSLMAQRNSGRYLTMLQRRRRMATFTGSIAEVSGVAIIPDSSMSPPPVGTVPCARLSNANRRFGHAAKTRVTRWLTEEMSEVFARGAVSGAITH